MSGAIEPTRSKDHHFPIIQITVTSLRYCSKNPLAIIAYLVLPTIVALGMSWAMITLFTPSTENAQWIGSIQRGLFALAGAATMTLMLMHILSGASGIGFNLYDFRHHFPRTTFALLVTYLGPLLAATAISLGTAKNGFPYLLEITWLAVGWICIKSFLVLPTVVSSGRVSILEGWRNTHGRFFRSAALICLSFLLVLTVQVALFIPLAFLLEWLGVEGWKFVFSLMNLSSPPMYAASTSVFAGTAFNWVDENLTAAVLPGPAS